MKNVSWKQLAILVAAWTMLASAAPALAQFDLGARAILTLADGVPANDIPGFGVFGHYRFGDRWSLGFALDRTEYDFEQPARLLGLPLDPDLGPIDSLAEATIVSAWLQRNYERAGRRTTWFWGAGLGLASLDVPDARGPLVAGAGTFDIRTEADSEIIASILAGAQWRLGSRGFLEFALRADQHFADWQLTDRISGRTGAIDDYFAYGGHLGIGFRF